MGQLGRCDSRSKTSTRVIRVAIDNRHACRAGSIGAEMLASYHGESLKITSVLLSFVLENLLSRLNSVTENEQNFNEFHNIHDARDC